MVRQGRRYGGTIASSSAERSSRNRIRGTGERSSGFAHRLLCYVIAEEFPAITVPFLQCVPAHDDALLAVTSEPNIRLFRDALGDDTDLIAFADSIDWYRHPARTFATHGGYADEHRVRIIGEPAELVFLVNEATYNTVERGGGRGILRMWCTRDHLVGDVTNPAVWPGGPLTGYLRRFAGRWSGSARVWRTARRRGGGGGPEWDWPG